MVQPPPDPAPRPTGWLKRLDRTLDLLEGPGLVVLAGDLAALERLARALAARGPTRVALDLDALRRVPPGSRVIYRMRLEDGPWLNFHRPFVLDERLQIFGWIEAEHFQAMREAAPDFMDWASPFLVAEATPPDWLLERLRALRPGPVVVDDPEAAVAALETLGEASVRIDPTQPWSELSMKASEAGWRVYQPVGDTWSAQRVAWLEWMVPGDQPFLLSGSWWPLGDLPHLYCQPARPAIGGLLGALELANELVPPPPTGHCDRLGAPGLPRDGEREACGWDDAAALAWTAGHADIALGLLTRMPNGAVLAERARSVGVADVIQKMEGRPQRPLDPDLDAIEGDAMRALSTRDQAGLDRLVAASFAGLQPESIVVRGQDLRANVLAQSNPEGALALWERVVLPGYRRLDWRDRIAATLASMAGARLRIGDLKGALTDSEASLTDEESVRVAARVHLLRNRRDRATEVLRTHPATAELADRVAAREDVPLEPARARVGTRWIRDEAGPSPRPDP